MTVQAEKEIFEEVHAGMTENEIAVRLRTRLFEKGAEDLTLLCVVSGPSTGGICLLPTDRVVRKGDTLGFDCGVTYKGYRLVDILPRRSPVVSGISAGEVLEISAIRLALEPLALAEAIPHMTGETIGRGGSLLEDFGRCSDPWEQVELNRKFHLVLYEPCGKKRLMKVISDQYDGMTHCVQVLVIQSSTPVDKSVMEHEQILSACEAKDLEKATAMLRSHLKASNDRLHRQLATG